MGIAAGEPDRYIGYRGECGGTVTINRCGYDTCGICGGTNINYEIPIDGDLVPSNEFSSTPVDGGYFNNGLGDIDSTIMDERPVWIGV